MIVGFGPEIGTGTGVETVNVKGSGYEVGVEVGAEVASVHD